MGQNPINILVIGSGAIGGLYGGMLSESKNVNVSYLCRSDFEKIKRDGIEIESMWKNFHFHPHSVIQNFKEYEFKPDYILVCLKVLPEIRLDLILNKINPSVTLVLLQNGIKIEIEVAKLFPENEIISGLAFTCVNRIASGKIKHLDYGQLTIGSFNRKDSPKTEILSKLFSGVGVPTEVSEDIETARWKKLVWNAPFNPISVLAGGANTAQILSNSESFQLVKKIMLEVCELAKVDGHELPADTPDKMIEMTLKMEPYKTSMLLDFELGRKMETEAILGNAIRVAEEKSILVPHLHTIYSILQLLEVSAKVSL